MSVSKRIFHELHRALDAIQEELRLLEQDFGLCADCGDHPPTPIRQRAHHGAPLRSVAVAERRRVA